MFYNIFHQENIKIQETQSENRFKVALHSVANFTKMTENDAIFQSMECVCDIKEVFI